MAYTNIDKPEDFFSATLYTGDGSADQSMTGAGFKPDFLWIKRRNASERHVLTNVQMGASSGAYKWLDSSDTHVEFTGGTGVASFDADGFTIKTSDTTWNASGSTYVFWSWKANGGTTSNLSGNLASVVQVNQAAGFSIVGYTGTGNSTSTIGHGITAGAPDLIICKNASQSGYSWAVYSSALPSVTNNLFLDFSGFINQYQDRFSAVTSTTFTAGSNYPEVNGNNDLMIAYCWKSVPGYSKIGSYLWSATSYTAGVMVNDLGFTPRFVMIKGTTVTSNWYIFDNMRGQTGTYVYQYPLAPDNADAEQTTGYQSIQFNSNGFSAMVWNAGGATTGSTGLNQINETYLYFAVA